MAQRAVCARVVSSQLLPLLTEYTQFRDLAQRFLHSVHEWHVQDLLPILADLESEVRRLQLEAHVRRCHESSGVVRPSPVPSVALSQGNVSVADSIRSAQATAALRRGQGPVVTYASMGLSEAAQDSHAAATMILPSYLPASPSSLHSQMQ